MLGWGLRTRPCPAAAAGARSSGTTPAPGTDGTALPSHSRFNGSSWGRAGRTPSPGPAPHRSHRSPAGLGPAHPQAPRLPPECQRGGRTRPSASQSAGGLGHSPAWGAVPALGVQSWRWGVQSWRWGSGGYRKPGKASCSSRMVATMSPAQSSSSSQTGREPAGDRGVRTAPRRPLPWVWGWRWAPQPPGTHVGWGAGAVCSGCRRPR